MTYLDRANYIRPSTAYAVTYDFSEGNSFQYCSEYVEAGEEWIIGLSPRNDVNEYLESVFTTHPNLRGVEIRYYEDEDEIDDYVTGDDYEDGPKLCFAVVFEEAEDNYYEYNIRFNQSYSVTYGDPLEFFEIFEFETHDATDDLLRVPTPEFQEDFVKTGFLQIQNYVDNYVLQKITGDSSAYIASGFVPMFYDDWVDDDFLSSIEDILPFILVIPFLLPICRMISQIVMEKEYKIKK